MKGVGAGPGAAGRTTAAKQEGRAEGGEAGDELRPLRELLGAAQLGRAPGKWDGLASGAASGELRRPRELPCGVGGAARSGGESGALKATGRAYGALSSTTAEAVFH